MTQWPRNMTRGLYFNREPADKMSTNVAVPLLMTQAVFEQFWQTTSYKSPTESVVLAVGDTVFRSNSLRGTNLVQQISTLGDFLADSDTTTLCAKLQNDAEWFKMPETVLLAIEKNPNWPEKMQLCLCKNEKELSKNAEDEFDVKSQYKIRIIPENGAFKVSARATTNNWEIIDGKEMPLFTCLAAAFQALKKQEADFSVAPLIGEELNGNLAKSESKDREGLATALRAAALETIKNHGFKITISDADQKALKQYLGQN